jgi:hypothetical protein
MRKTMVLCFVIALTAITTVSCRKVTKTHPEFVGFWSVNDGGVLYVIDIDNEGEGRYQESSSIMSAKKWEGPTRFKNGVLKIGIKKLNVDKEPYTVGQFKLMDVEGKTFVRQ